MSKYYNVEVKEDGTIIWKNQNDQIHREDGPAIIYPDGGEYWYQNGKFHREDGPAIIYPNGYKFWYKNGIPIK